MNYKTVWMSDLHLGTPACNAEGILEFLRNHECDRLYLVGDIVDLWQLRKNRHWPQAHNDVVQKILRKARKGTEVIYIPGNHDEFVASFLGFYGNVMVKSRDVYTTLTGRRLLVMHGHEFDMVTLHARWLALLGDIGYTLLLKANRPINFIRRLCGWDYWSLSAAIKHRVKNAVSFISDFEDAVSHFAATHRADGIVCGHIHTPAIRRIRQVDYYNCGDWVESSTALVEHRDGTLELTGPPAMTARFTRPVLLDAEPAAALALPVFAANSQR
jgi:UDP-2,3-diacylglucosamine pyrophosphatase LpxH